MQKKGQSGILSAVRRRSDNALPFRKFTKLPSARISSPSYPGHSPMSSFQTDGFCLMYCDIIRIRSGSLTTVTFIPLDLKKEVIAPVVHHFWKSCKVGGDQCGTHQKAGVTDISRRCPRRLESRRWPALQALEPDLLGLYPRQSPTAVQFCFQ